MGTVLYIRSLALSLMRQLRVAPRTEMKVGEDVHQYFVRRGPDIECLLRPMKAETLGRIIACAQPSIPGRRGKMTLKVIFPWLDLHRGGLGILRELASAVIIAEMLDILRET